MDSNVGLDYIVDNPDYCNKLASALDTACTSVKKQVVELLSALCVYSQDGRQRVWDTLHIYQERKGERYRLRAIVDELQRATGEDYQAALLAFINCLVISTPVLKDRVRLRNEFIGLKLLPILNDLRKQKNQFPDLRVQLDVFDDQRETDEELTNQGPPGIDLSSHVDVFYAILGQIADTPQEIPFLSILQHLLRLDPKEAASDLAWDTAETLVHRATLLENREDVTKLLRSPSLQTNLCCHCRGIDQTSTPRKASLPTGNSSSLPVSPPVPPVPPAPPNPPVTLILPPPPPPPLFVNANITDGAMEPPLPPPLNVQTLNRAPTPEPPANNTKLLPQQEIPTPKTKMKTINWNKIPNHKVIGKRNIWSLVANEHQNSPMADLDWAEMEGLFCQQLPPIIPQSTSINIGNGNDTERKRREPTEIALLDGKRSLNVNIFLKQFRSSNEDIIQLIRDGGHDDIGAEKLRGLLKILPEVDELEMLKSFDGDFIKLGNAEKFFLQLIQVPNYKLRIECMLLKEEFAANMSYLEPSINSMIIAGDDLMTNKELQEMLYMVLVAGNFLNSGGYAGNAAGVKLSSLQKLTEIRANKPGMNLIHYVALQAERKRKDLLNFARNMNTLEAAAKTTIEQLTNEFNTLDTKIKKIKTQIQLSSTENDIQEQMAQFLKMAEQEMGQLQRDMEELEGVRRTLAEFFCEDINTFKIEECYRIFHQFCQKFNQAVAENERRRIQEEQVNARRRQREEQLLAKKRLLSNQVEISGSEYDCNINDYGILDIQSGLLRQQYGRSDGKIKRLQNGGVTSDEDISITGSPNIRRRVGSCSGGPDQQITKEDTYSPDITPNGTLRRRRSRIPCEDDDNNLMDFLRTSSGHDNTRERKSWGSLDRSWARRARGQPRRGDLLNADFSGDRERPNSPSPLAETKSFLQVEEEVKPTGRAWRQKIEAWLSENEKEEKAGEELQKKARQLQIHRKSFEDSENEGKANTLLEENSRRAEYSDVYDWRPTVEKTDVMRTMEAIEEAQPHTSQSEKSSWRKTIGNVSSSNDDNDPKYTRRIRTRLTNDNVLGQSTLQAIREEERKKNKTTDISSIDDQDILTIYLRQPSTTSTPAIRRFSKVSNKSIDNKISDRIEIDSDNIETPPVTRRVFSPPRDVKPVEKEPCKRERCNNSQGREIKVITPKSTNVNSDFGSGNFDRYSAARKTRRYKKNHDSLVEKESIKPDGSISPENLIDKVPRPNTLSLVETNVEINQDDDAMLRVWQDKLKRRNASNDVETPVSHITKTVDDIQKLSRKNNSRLPITQQPAPVVAVSNTVLSPVMQESKPREMTPVWPERAVSCRERHRSMIDPSQVREAMGLTSNPPSQYNQLNKKIIDKIDNCEVLPILRISSPDLKQDSVDLEICEVIDKNLSSNKIGDSNTDKVNLLKQNSPLFKSRFIPDINISSNSPTIGKSKDQELNDEGFEETQSLVSESLSQETSSGNYETDLHDSPRCSPAEQHYTRDTNDSGNRIIAKDEIARLKAFGPRLGSIRSKNDKISYLPKKKDNTIREIKCESPKIILKSSRNDVERSGSRSSLRSSRSSLNSATSVNTVRKLPPNHSQLRNYTSAICAMANDLRKGSNNSSISHVNKDNEKRTISTRSTATKIPASRSSSSGSSVGPVVRNLRKLKPGINDASKIMTTKSKPMVSSRSNSNNSIGSNQMLQNRILNSKTLTSASSKTKLIQPRNHSFMRPTAASVNKGSISNLPKSFKSCGN